MRLLETLMSNAEHTYNSALSSDAAQEILLRWEKASTKAEALEKEILRKNNTKLSAENTKKIIEERLAALSDSSQVAALKTAYGDLESIYFHIQELKNVVRRS